MRKSAILAATVLVAGCAAKPESIQASYVSEVTYQHWTCQQLAEETLRLNAAYATAAKQQNQARGNDIAGVILIGLPVSSMSGGNVAPEIARLKGEQEAVRKAMITKNCSEQPAPVQTTAPAKTG
jgi:hypothetical protein